MFSKMSAGRQSDNTKAAGRDVNADILEEVEDSFLRKSSGLENSRSGDVQEDASQCSIRSSDATGEGSDTCVKSGARNLSFDRREATALEGSCLSECIEAIKQQAFWPTNCRQLRWMQRKREVLLVIGSLDLLLIVILASYIAAGRHNLVIILPSLVTACACTSLLCTLFLDYAGSQTACQYVSPLLFLLAFLSWYIPNVSCQFSAFRGWCDPVSHNREVLGLLISLGFPWLLTAAPIMTWQASCLLSVVIPFMFFSTLASKTVINIVISRMLDVPLTLSVLVITNICICYLRNWTDSEILAKIEVLERAFQECKATDEQSHKDLEEMEKGHAEKISKMRQFISYIFHEIRVPFNAVVLGVGHMLASNVSDDQREILKMMDSSSSSMIRILNDVLDMGKIEAGKLQLEKQAFNMGELVNSLVWAFKDTLDSKGIEFSQCIDHGTKELLSNYDLIGDKHRVRQVLANYLSNAAKFTPRGGKVSLRVVCNGIFSADKSIPGGEQGTTSSQRNLKFEGREKSSSFSVVDECKEENASTRRRPTIASVTISVEDTGIGISKDDQARLFEPYMQISAGASQGGGGTGLGLSFAKRIVEMAGGNIGVFSELGKGSVFLFTMPFQLVELLSNNTNKEVSQNKFDAATSTKGLLSRSMSSTRIPGSFLTGQKPKVLIVEDNSVNRKILRKLLASFNVDSDDVEDGKQAVELCRSGALYDMILIDKEMPVMDGHEATRELRAMGIKTPIVGLTGNALDSDRNQFLAAGVDDFFTKPISRHQLVKLLQAHRLIELTREDSPSSLPLSSLANSP